MTKPTASIVHDFRKVGVMVTGAPDRTAALDIAQHTTGLPDLDIQNAYVSGGHREGQWYIEFSLVGPLDPSTPITEGHER